MSGRTASGRDDLLLKPCLDRLRAIDKIEPDDGHLLAALRDQSWVVHAVVNSGGSPAVQSAAKLLLSLIQSETPAENHVRRALRSLLSSWQSVHSKRLKSRKASIKWAALSSAAATFSTTFAILLGQEGLVHLLLNSKQAAQAAQEPAKYVQYDQPRFYLSIIHVLVITLFLLLKKSPWTLRNP